MKNLKVEYRTAETDIAPFVQAGYPVFLANLYAQRGVISPADVVGVLPAYTRLKGAVKAAELLGEAVTTHKKIVIVADYDCDGATGCAVAYRCLKNMRANVEYLIPHRQDHGYGLSEDVARFLMDKHPDTHVVLTVDNGISSFPGVDYLKSNGVKVVVTDHHLPGSALPNADVIVNPNQPGCKFPSKNIAGCGVVYFVMKALNDLLQTHVSMEHLLPLVAVGTIADVVALDGVNRTLVARGMNMIRQSVGPVGLLALAKSAGLTIHNMTTIDVAFMIAPRLNAAGRLQSMDIGVHTLVTDNHEEARFNAATLSDINDQRKRVESQMLDEAISQVNELETDAIRSLVAFNKTWHQGVVGIVAGRLKEMYWKPTLAFAMEVDGNYKGSCRSVPGLNMRDALDAVTKKESGIILKFGGHAMAAGLTVARGKLERFAELFEAVVSEMLPKSDRILYSDGSLEASDISLETAVLLEQQVWGQGFPPPMFTNTFKVVEQKFMRDKATGKEKHSRLKVKLGNEMYTAVCFNQTDRLTGDINLAYVPVTNRFQGYTSLQLRVEQVLEQ